jgi:hypothetical protein
MAIWYILRPFDKFHRHLEYFVVIWYIFPCFGMLYQKHLATILALKLERAFVLHFHKCTYLSTYP